MTRPAAFAAALFGLALAAPTSAATTTLEAVAAAVGADRAPGWLVSLADCEGPDGERFATGVVWVSLMARDDDGRWRRVGNASSGR